MASDRRKYRDRAKYIIKAVAKRRKKIKRMAIEYKGGNCFFCGYSRDISALEFHHVDPKTKEFSLSVKGLTRAWEKTRKELDKCILVCANCHRELHSGILQLPSENSG